MFAVINIAKIPWNVKWAKQKIPDFSGKRLPYHSADGAASACRNRVFYDSG